MWGQGCFLRCGVAVRGWPCCRHVLGLGRGLLVQGGPAIAEPGTGDLGHDGQRALTSSESSGPTEQPLLLGASAVWTNGPKVAVTLGRLTSTGPPGGGGSARVQETQ